MLLLICFGWLTSSSSTGMLIQRRAAGRTSGETPANSASSEPWATYVCHRTAALLCYQTGLVCPAISKKSCWLRIVAKICAVNSAKFHASARRSRWFLRACLLPIQVLDRVI